MTSDERVEIAEQLRKHNGRYYEELVNMSDSDLADLIDPTCHVVGTTSEEGLYDGLTIFRHELSCGHTCETVWLEPPAYSVPSSTSRTCSTMTF